MPGVEYHRLVCQVQRPMIFRQERLVQAAIGMQLQYSDQPPVGELFPDGLHSSFYFGRGMGKIPVYIEVIVLAQQLQALSRAPKSRNALQKDGRLDPQFLTGKVSRLQVQQIMLSKDLKRSRMSFQRNNSYAVFDPVRGNTIRYLPHGRRM